MLALLVAAAPLHALAQQTDTEAARFYEDALVRYEKQDLAGAIIQLKNALQIDRNLLPVHVLLGKALLANGDVAGAELAFVESLRLGISRGEVVLPLAQSLVAQGKQEMLLQDARFSTSGLPRQVQAALLVMKAGASADLGRTQQAFQAIDEARAINAQLPDSWLAEVPVRIRAGQLPEAQLAADKALSLAPGDAEALYTRGQVAHVQGELLAALKWYDKAIEARSGHVDARVSRAGLLVDLNRPADAERDVAALLKTSPTEPRASYLKALLAERAGRKTEARDAYNSVTALLDPVPPEFLRYRPQLLMLGGLSHYALRQFEKARPYLERVQRQQPGSPVVKLLAQILLSEGKVDRAAEALEAYLRLTPGDTQAMLLLASAQLSQGRYSRAAQLAQDGLQRQDTPGLQALLGLSMMGAGRYADAAAELEALLKKDPRQIQAGSALALLYLKSGQAQDAVRVVAGLVKSHPGEPGLQNLLGEARAAAGDADLARAAYEQALRLDAKFAAPQIGLARLDRLAGAPERSIKRLDALLLADANNAEAMSELSAALEAAGRLLDAQRWLEKADDLAGPDNVNTSLALVDFHLRHRQTDLAREAMKRAMVKAPESGPVLTMGARVSLAAGDRAAARTALTRVAGLLGYDAPALLRVALLQMQAGHAAGAAHSLDKALTERPDFLPALALRAQVDIHLGDLPAAEQRARQILSRSPKAGVAHSLLGEVALAAGEPARAVAHFRRAQQVEPSIDNVMRLHRILTAQQAPDANQPIEAWLKTHPRDPIARRALADAHARAGRLAAARTAYQSLLELAPDDAEALNNLANVLVLLKDPSALAVAERALALQPATPHILGTTGWAAFKAGQTDRALQLLRDARLRDPANPQTRYFLGVVLAGSGRDAEAREELQAALAADRPFAAAPDAESLLRTLK